MVLESTMICVDNSDYMRNGDFVPTRLQAQQDAVNLVCHSKTRSNPENNVGLITLANSHVQVMATLTSDVGRILAKLHQVQPSGEINFPTGLRIAHLALKHRQGKNHKMRIIAFIGSPITTDEKEIIKLAKRLKKEKVNVDVVSFGEDEINNPLLSAFINTLNGKDGSSSHLVSIPPGPHLSDALISSPVIQGEDGNGAASLGGTGYEFGVDPNEDPELALALRVSMEEQRQRQEQEGRRAQTTADSSDTPTPPSAASTTNMTTEEAMLERALAMSMEPEAGPSGLQSETTNASSYVDFESMTEEEQIEFAMRMSMQENATSDSVKPEKTDKPKDEAMEVDSGMDTEYLKSVLENLSGIESLNTLPTLPATTIDGGNSPAKQDAAADKLEDGKDSKDPKDQAKPKDS